MELKKENIDADLVIEYIRDHTEAHESVVLESINRHTNQDVISVVYRDGHISTKRITIYYVDYIDMLTKKNRKKSLDSLLS